MTLSLKKKKLKLAKKAAQAEFKEETLSQRLDGKQKSTVKVAIEEGDGYAYVVCEMSMGLIRDNDSLSTKIGGTLPFKLEQGLTFEQTLDAWGVSFDQFAGRVVEKLEAKSAEMLDVLEPKSKDKSLVPTRSSQSRD